ncbi:MAG TPA: hypothetical protein VGO19_03430 [Actinomycetes bacterium]|jgi:hypothetical protein
MYAWIWRNLPGPVPVRLLISLALVVAVIALLFTVVFPWAEKALPFLHVTVNSQ